MNSSIIFPRHEIEAQELWGSFPRFTLLAKRRKKKCLQVIETILNVLRTLESLEMNSAAGKTVREELHHWLLVKQEIEKK